MVNGLRNPPKTYEVHSVWWATKLSRDFLGIIESDSLSGSLIRKASIVSWTFDGIVENPSVLTFEPISHYSSLSSSVVGNKNSFFLSFYFVVFSFQEHMTLHTGEAYLYTCTFCSKTFRSSANMYAHRKRNHPREYEEKCVLAKMQKA